MRYSEKWPVYAKQWDAMTINPGRLNEFKKAAQEIFDHKATFLEIQEATAHDGIGKEGEGVPWYMIGLLLLREAGSPLNFKAYLGNGQPLSRRTTIRPAGRGPFTGPKAFFNGALDALKVDGLSAILDWRLEKVLYWMELFNGAGYFLHGLPSPYIWGGTNQQKKGKYIRDGVFDRNVMDTQPGCAPVLYLISKLDPSIKFTRES